MLRYENKGQVIEIKLPEECGHEGYKVECRYKYDRSAGKYLLSMWLKQETVDDTFKIDGQEIDTQYISGNPDTIRFNICRIVEQASLCGFFEPYIQRYKYTYKCFEKGMVFFEMEQKG